MSYLASCCLWERAVTPRNHLPGALLLGKRLKTWSRSGKWESGSFELLSIEEMQTEEPEFLASSENAFK